MSYPAESYESYMVPALFAPWASYLVQSANPQPGERVLDVACGTGIVARRIAPHVGSHGMIVGLDHNPNMLAVAHAAAKQQGLTIEWHEGRAEKLLFPNDNFDLVLCQFGLMLFTDRRAALTEMHRVLKTSGRVVLSVWQRLGLHPFYQMLHNVSQRRLGTSGVEDAFALGDVDELRKLLMEAGFRGVEIEPVSIIARFPDPKEFLAWEIDIDPATIPAMQHLDAQAQRAIMEAIREDMQAPLHEVMQDGQVVIPFHAHVARARR
jgi:ubiquinone/menaquinone biosynthesis C-methylase UbiE